MAEPATGAAVPDAAALFADAVAQHRGGRFGAAERLYRRVPAIAPGHAEALDLLGALAHQAGRHDEALALIGEAIRRDPGQARYYSDLGSVQQHRGDVAAAIDNFRRAIALDPSFVNAHYNLGNALNARQQPEAAIASYRNALAIDARHARSLENLAGVLTKTGRAAEAMACLEKAIAIDPGSALAHGQAGGLLWSAGRLQAAAAMFRRSLACDPDHHQLHSDLIFLLTYNALVPPAEILAEARRWERRHARPLMGAAPPHDNDPDPDRRLRIGYVSPDLRSHSVAHFMEPLLAAHDRRQVEIYGYAEVARPDATTARLQALADHWRFTVGRDDRAVARQIRDDRIDILVDLAGHTAGSRLKVFALRPAPVQATWLGYLGTTGLSAIDYIIASPALIPESQRAYYAEAVLDIPGYVTFEVPGMLPDTAPAPVASRGHVTFGCFNNANKIGRPVVEAWCRILERVPSSRLILKSGSFADPEIQAAFRRRFAARGIAGDRLELRGPSHYREYLASYGDIDIALDPFPANGGTTTRDTLLMGVPLVALMGQTLPGRVAAATLAAIGLGRLIGHSVDDYVAVAVGLAADPSRLGALRREVRQLTRSSLVSDTAALTRNVEDGFRRIWRRWCEPRQGARRHG
jgi:protein O-GlcNAc transferase